MGNKVVEFPSEAVKERRSVEEAIADLRAEFEADNLENLIICVFRKDGQLDTWRTRGLTVAQNAYGIACLQNDLFQFLSGHSDPLKLRE